MLTTITLDSPQSKAASTLLARFRSQERRNALYTLFRAQFVSDLHERILPCRRLCAKKVRGDVKNMERTGTWFYEFKTGFSN
jgi:hypothetical protein